MWSNWSGNQSCGGQVHRPAGAKQILQIVRNTTGTIRPAGSGHSFSPLVAGAEHVVSPAPENAPPVRSATGSTARVDANANLRDVSEALGARGLAFRNLGDINVQTIAGAVSTATHGTGVGLPCLSAGITGVQLIDGSGELLEVDEADMPGARVGLGLLGLITEIGIAAVPSFNLRRRAGVRSAEALIEGMHEKWTAHRNYEFFLLPHSGRGIEVAHDVSDAPPGKPPLDLDELGVAYLRATSGLRRVSPGLRRAAIAAFTAMIADEDYVGESWRVLCATRKTRFNEMEYHLPPDTAKDIIGEITRLIERRHTDVWFPIEVRQTAGDEPWLSPFQHGARVSVAVHMHARQRYGAFFRDCEAAFREAGGRPHWGKLHNATRHDLEDMYPDLPKFDALRARLDPKDRFLSLALAGMFRP